MLLLLYIIFTLVAMHHLILCFLSKQKRHPHWVRRPSTLYQYWLSIQYVIGTGLLLAGMLVSYNSLQIND